MPFDGTEFRNRAALAPPLTLTRRVALALHRAFRELPARIAPGRTPPARPLRRGPVDGAVLRVLEEARGLIEQREDWVQGTYETWRGERCAVGALRSVATLLDYPAAGTAAEALLERIARQQGYRSIEAMNDRVEHDAVLSAFDAALAVARGWRPTRIP